jgi:hypothetical protein
MQSCAPDAWSSGLLTRGEECSTDDREKHLVVERL